MSYTIYKGLRIIGYMYSTKEKADVQRRASEIFGYGVIAR